MLGISPESIVLIDLRKRPREPLSVEVTGLQLLHLSAVSAQTVRLAALAVAVYDHERVRQVSRLVTWAWEAAMPLLTLEIDAATARLGPLTIPGRVGCAHCAQERIRAAAAFTDPANHPLDDSMSEQDFLRWTCELLSHELAVACLDPLRSSLLDHVLAWTTCTNREPSRHRIIPLASCHVCGGARALRQEGSVLSRNHSTIGDTDPLAGWVDPVTGVIPALHVDQVEGSGLPVVVTAAPPHVIAEDGSMQALPAGWGKGVTLADALRSAIGEAIERYSASLPDPARLLWARPSELSGEHLDPRLFPLYRAAQYARPGFPYVGFDPSVRHPWVRGCWLSGGDGDVWVPAILAFLSLTIEPANLICQGSSNGLAASTEWDDAALRAVLELIERDAMMTTWLTGASGLRIELDSSLELEFREIVEQIVALGAAVELYLLPSSVCGASAVCLTVGDGVAWPGTTVALAADLDPRAAVRRALLELGQTGPYLRELLVSGRVAPAEHEADVQTMLDHATYYFPAERAGAFAPLRTGVERIAFADLGGWEGDRSLAACASALEKTGIRIVLVDVTAADVGTGPFRVVRAISPDLQPISFGYGCERVPVERIRARAETSDAPPIHPIW